MPRRTPPSCRSASQQPQPFVPIRSIAVLPSFTHPSSPLSRPGFPRFPPSFTPARPPSPLSPPSQNPITPRATSYVQQPNPHTRTRRASLPRDQIDFVRVSSSGLLFSDFFAIVKRCLATLSLSCWYRSNKLKTDIIGTGCDRDVIQLWRHINICKFLRDILASFAS